MSTRNVAILGEGGHAQEIAATLEHNNEKNFVRLDGHNIKSDVICYFLDENNRTYDIPSYVSMCEILIGSGNMKTRKKMLIEANSLFKSTRYWPGTCICKSAQNLGFFGDGNVILQNAVIGNCAILDDHILINYGATIGHDTTIGELSVVSPNASIGGHCKIGKAVFVGAGAMIRENLSVGDDAIIGMGAIVTKDVPANSVVIGTKMYTAEEWNAKKSKS